MMRHERIRNSAKSLGCLKTLSGSLRAPSAYLRSLFAIAITVATLRCGDAYPAALVLVAADSAPTAYMEDGKPTGILVDVVTEALQRAGHPFEIQLMPWARCLAEVRSGRVDGIFSVFKLPERNEFLTYTRVPIITQVEAFFVPAESDVKFGGDISKLGSFRLGIIRDTSYGAAVDGALKAGVWPTVVETNNVDSLVGMLVLKRIDLAIGYRHVILEAAKKKGYLNGIKELSPGIDEIPSYLAFTRQRDFSAVIADFDRALMSMKDDHRFQAIYEKYLGTSNIAH